MAAGWFGDNSGPADVNTTEVDFASLRVLFPNASVESASFDEFFAIANQPKVKAKLPVVTKDIGDGEKLEVKSEKPEVRSEKWEVSRKRKDLSSLK